MEVNLEDPRIVEALKWAKKLDLVIVEPITAPWLDRVPWLEARLSGIGSSEIWQLFSDDPDDRLTLYDNKTGNPEPDLVMGPDLERGRVYEDIAAAKYEELTGRKTIPLPLLRHSEFPFLITDVDRLILPGTGTGEWFTAEPMILEIKCPRGHVFTRYKRKGLSDKIIWQQTHHATVTRISGTAFAAFDSETLEILPWDIDAQTDLIARIEIDGEEFWEENVEKRIAPEVGEVPVPGVAIDGIAGDTVTRDDEEYLAAAALFREIHPVFKEAETLMKEAKAAIKKVVGKTPARYEGGGVAVNNYLKEGSVSWKGSFEAVDNAFPLDVKKLRDILRGSGILIVLKEGDEPRALTEGEIEGEIHTITNDCILDLEALTVTGKPSVVCLPRLVREED